MKTCARRRESGSYRTAVGLTDYSLGSATSARIASGLLPLEGTSTMSSSATRVPSAEEGAGWVHVTFPEAHRRQIRSTNPLERLNKELNDGD